MNLFTTAGLIMVVCGMTHGTIEEVVIPDVIIGDPNQFDDDVLGDPISEKELEDSLSIKVSEYPDPKEDPISTSGYYQGDIMIESKDNLLQILEGDPNGQFSAIKNPHKTWSRGVIPYVISSTYNHQERAVIARAMAEYHRNTCIRFVPRTSHADYIHIHRGRGCSSYVGRTRGVQVVSLGNGCVHSGVVIHEFMHAAGFWHEQSRYDRDNYVNIYWANILPGQQFNFDKKSNAVTTDLGLPYDYQSVMHYGSYAFTRRYGSPTILPKQRGITLGQRNGFSQTDVKGLNLLYKCSGVGPKPKPGGCTDEHEHCSSWASKGYCKTNAAYMMEKCKKSCNACEDESCKDIGEHCGSWAASGECKSNPKYMEENCKKSCNKCSNESCQDKNEYCQDWAKKGECSRNPAYMNKDCQKSCDKC